MPEGFVEPVGQPDIELAGRVVGVRLQRCVAGEQGPLDEQQVIAHIFGLGGHAHDGIDQFAKELAVAFEEYVRIVPEQEAVAAGGPAVCRVSAAEQGDHPPRPQPPSSQRRPRAAVLKLGAEALKLLNVASFETEDFGVSLSLDELSERSHEVELSAG